MPDIRLVQYGHTEVVEWWEPKNNGPRFYKISVSSRFGVNNRFRRDKNGIIVSAGHLLKTLRFAEKENTYQEFSLEAIIDHPSKLTIWNYLRPPSWFWVTSGPKIDGTVPPMAPNGPNGPHSRFFFRKSIPGSHPFPTFFENWSPNSSSRSDLILNCKF